MAQVRVHNITDRPNVETPAYAVKVGGSRVRPGKFITVDDTVLTPKFRKLHGTAVWIGDAVPQKYRATSRAALKGLMAMASLTPMTIDQGRAYLSSLKKPELLSLCNAMSPALSFSKEPSFQMLVVKLARACFSDSKVLDPESFFWLRRWTKHGNSFAEIS
jgi:hypothetical protein